VTGEAAAGGTAPKTPEKLTLLRDGAGVLPRRAFLPDPFLPLSLESVEF
jgi:hypothetical protein